MSDVQTVAKEASEWFEIAQRATGDTEHGPREDGESYVRVKDGAPEWVTELVYEAHGDMLPDDWRYECIRAAVDQIAETGDDDSAEFADGHVDVYTSALFDWLASHGTRQGYVDEAASEFGLPAEGDFSITEAIGRGQYMEASEVFGLVLSALEERAEAIGDRLEELREALREESISWGELAELQGLAAHIDSGDVELLEAAGVPENGEVV